MNYTDYVTLLNLLLQSCKANEPIDKRTFKKLLQSIRTIEAKARFAFDLDYNWHSLDRWADETNDLAPPIREWPLVLNWLSANLTEDIFAPKENERGISFGSLMSA